MTLPESIQLCKANFKLTKEEALVFVSQQHSDQPADVRAAAIEAAYPDAVEPETSAGSAEPASPVPVEPAVQAAPEPAVEPVWAFKDIALPMIARGVPVTPLNGKAPRLDNWQNTASTDPEQIALWDRQFPNANGGSVAQAKLGGFWMLEVDSAEVWDRIERETGEKIPLTFRIRSGSKGRGHFYWKQTPESIRMSNCSQSAVKFGDWSARVDRQQCVSPGSLHPITGLRYKAMNDAEIVEAPNWLIDWCISQRVTASAAATPNAAANPTANLSGYGCTYGPGVIIQKGKRNAALASYGGWLRQVKQYEEDQIIEALLDNNRKEFHPPLPEEEVIRTAKSVARYPIKDTTVLVGGVPAGSAQQPVVQAPFEVPPESVLQYPKFPEWVMQGTSVYERLCKPFLDKNCRHGQFMFLPAVTLMLNYIAVHVRVEYEDLIPNIFMVSIGKRGETFKSACANDACEYFRMMGFADHASSSVQTADAKSYIFTVGSSEGLGVEMQRTNCKHVILFYDEFSKLVSKSGIQSSSLAGDLLTLYESDKFANGIKSRKDGFSIPPKSYAVGFIACTTPEDFPEQWGLLANGKRGLDDRFFFLLQPEQLNKLTPPQHVDCHEGAQKTKALIEKALRQGLYKMDPSAREMLAGRIEQLGNRPSIRAEKFALYFAVDLGLDEIDLDCIERGLALAKYEQDVKRYLLAGDTESRLAGWQNKLRRILQHEKSWSLPLAVLKRKMKSDRFSTDDWLRIYKGLVSAGMIQEIGQGKDIIVQLLVGLTDPMED